MTKHVSGTCEERPSLCWLPDKSEGRSSERAFLGVSMALFTVSAAVTIIWCTSMSTMEGMPMPGGWTMSMTWMRMPGQTWMSAMAYFLGMWLAMMVAMMLPSLIPTLYRYRQAIGSWGEMRAGRLTALVSTAYFLVWTALGMAAFPVGVTLNELAMQEPEFARAVPLMAGVVVLVAGVLQLTPWKGYYLSCCRGTVERSRRWRPDAGAAWRYGLRLGLHCTLCCAPLTAILLVIGVMDLRAMTLVTVAITLERLARAGERVARVTGAVAIGAGLVLVVRAVGVL